MTRILQPVLSLSLQHVYCCHKDVRHQRKYLSPGTDTPFIRMGLDAVLYNNLFLSLQRIIVFQFPEEVAEDWEEFVYNGSLCSSSLRRRLRTARSLFIMDHCVPVP